VVSGKDPMTNYPYILFNQSPLQLRAIGARGGRAYGRNQRARRARLALMPVPPPTVLPRTTQGPTAAEAVALLDAQFPWLRAAEKRAGRETASAHGTRLRRGNKSVPALKD
jgi:hypothetical protein